MRITYSLAALGGLMCAELLCGGATAFAQPAAQAESPAVSADSDSTQTAVGITYHDRNENGVFDDGDKPLQGIRVSNGRDIVTTDENGKYELSVTDDTILFVIKPQGYRTPLSKDNLPRFYYIHKPNGSPDFKFPGVAATGPLPESVDFPLYRQKEPDQFQAILFGDTQPRNQEEVDYIAHDVIEDLIGTKASLGVTLGDIAFDNLDTMESLNQTIALLGIPWYNVIGNHDLNYDASERKLANETYERIYGPSYYAFDHGPVHFLVIDNIEWTPGEPGTNGRYQGGIGKDQLEFIRNDLKQVPEEKLVVLMMHIPLTSVTDRHGLYRLIEKRPYCLSISGHTHFHEHVWITKDDGWEGPEPHHHIINVTVCGSWWSGTKDERGIPHTTMADGGPNGYSLLSFDGHGYTLDYRAAGRAQDYQMEIDAPETLTAGAEKAESVYVNFFNGSKKDTLKLKVNDGDWHAMEYTREPDPKYKEMFEREDQLLSLRLNPPFRKLPSPKVSSHLWKSKLPVDLPVGTHLITIEAHDQWGREFRAERRIRVVE
uniref:Metallophosphoesterase n=2 Tax=Rubinisphaera brasiliensis TaxID=119 RepID=F0SMI8_RUBBR|nr:metallophosphoesterase [Rubinisphaera brasiliensis DSM 5305]